MSERPSFLIPPAEARKQQEAIDPGASVWVSANAGSGKTTILTKRVVRLLLAGIDPAKILCLTYTKAAAAEMQNRVFALLGAWVGLDDAALSREIEALEGAPPARGRLLAARRLFAEALETPGGLKIQTIHAFCERLLHLFPFEANVPARFRMLDDAEQAVILETCLDEIQLGLPEDDPDAVSFAEAVLLVAQDAGSKDFAKTVRDAMAQRDAVRRFAGLRSDGKDDIDLRRALRMSDTETLDTLDGETVSGALPLVQWLAAAEQLRATGKSTEKTLGDALAAAHGTIGLAEQAAAYRAMFLTGGGAPKARMTTKGTPAALAEILVEEKARILVLLDRRRGVLAYRRTQALFRIADRAAALYLEEKRRRAALDFSDLIARTAALLDRVDASWILFKLDAGLEHLLIDEAQDTSPEQWRILTALTAEFFAGKGQSGAHRTVFAVGDEKQSIFSFQGAAPKQFDRQRRLFKARAEAGRSRFAPVELQLSFRTVKDVLLAVDTVFTGDRFAGLGAADAGGTVHETVRHRQPGLVEIWPIELPDAVEEIDEEAEVDALPPRATEVKLAERIARRIAFWLESGARYEDDGSRIRAGDVMILVRKRSAFFECVIRALKRAGVPVAGADRMELTAHIAVTDLLAAGEIALLPDDDLSLATVLKSPLIGFDDDDLIALVADRSRTSLYESLGSAAADDLRFAEAFARIEGWRRLAREAHPFRFFSSLLGEEGGRRRMLARLGADAAEVMDVFLGDVLAWQQKNPPSLFSFLAFMRGASRMVKRELESGTDAVRVMTAHAAKGLEARIVFLPDTLGALHWSQEPKLFDIGPPAPEPDERPFPEPPIIAWSPAARHDSASLSAARAAWRQEALGESRRLLYVGMTRARDRLYVAAYGRKTEPHADVWYRMIDPVLTQHSQAEKRPAEDDAAFEVIQWRSADRDPPAPPLDQHTTDAPAPLPDWIREAAPATATPAPPLQPSGARASRAEPASDPSALDSRRRGILIHMALERLPAIDPANRITTADRLLRKRAPNADMAALAALRDQAIRIVEDQRFSMLFGVGSRAEVDISGSIMIGGRLMPVSARVDRLAVTETEVLVADFKTGAPPSDQGTLPDEMLRQLALYRDLLRRIYPGRSVRAGILWTEHPMLVFPGEAALDESLSGLGKKA